MIELSPLTKEEFEYLELLLHNHEYEENERHLIDSLEYKFNKSASIYLSRPFDNKLTALGG